MAQVIAMLMVYSAIAVSATQLLASLAQERRADAVTADMRLLVSAQNNLWLNEGDFQAGAPAVLAARLDAPIPLRQGADIYTFANVGGRLLLRAELGEEGLGLQGADARGLAFRVAARFGEVAGEANDDATPGAEGQPVDGRVEVTVPALAGIDVGNAEPVWLRRDGTLPMTGDLVMADNRVIGNRIQSAPGNDVEIVGNVQVRGALEMNTNNIQGVGTINANVGRMDTLSTSNFNYVR